MGAEPTTFSLLQYPQKCSSYNFPTGVGFGRRCVEENQDCRGAFREGSKRECVTSCSESGGDALRKRGRASAAARQNARTWKRARHEHAAGGDRAGEKEMKKRRKGSREWLSQSSFVRKERKFKLCFQHSNQMIGTKRNHALSINPAIPPAPKFFLPKPIKVSPRRARCKACSLLCASKSSR